MTLDELIIKLTEIRYTEKAGKYGMAIVDTSGGEAFGIENVILDTENKSVDITF